MTSRHDKSITYLLANLDVIAEFVMGTGKDPRAHWSAKRRHLETVARRDAMPALIDGYPSSHGSPGVGGNSELTAVEAAAARLVEHGQPRDETHAAVELLKVNAKQAADRVVSIDNAQRRIPTQARTDVFEGNDPTWCRSCLRLQTHTVKAAGHTRCDWCEGFARTYGHEPPLPLLDMHLTGRRITTNDIARHVPRKAS